MIRINAVLFLVLPIVLGLSLPSIAQDEEMSDAPYIYYYSDILNAFVIERADGSDSRVFGADLMPESPTIGSGPGWSPSGEWFAWTDNAHRERGWNLYLLDVSGTRSMTFQNDASQIFAEWSPEEDLLFTIEIEGEFQYTGDDTPRLYEATLSLVDPETNHIEAVHTETISGFWGFNPMVWTTDGDYALTRHTILQEEMPFTVYVAVSKQGEVVQHAEPGRDFSNVTQDGFYVHNVNYEDTSVTVRNIITGDHQDYAVPSDGYVIRFDYVHNHSIRMELVEADCEDGDQCPTLTWYLFPSKDKSIILDYSSVSWSPNETDALLRDDDGMIGHLDAETLAISETSIPPITADHLRIHWHNNSIAIIESDSSYLLYNIAHDTIETLDVPEGFGTQPLFSNDLRYFVRERSFPPMVYDRQGEPLSFLPHSGTRFGYYLDTVRWQSSSSWWISWESGWEGSGQGDLVSVRDTNGYRRELGRCFAGPLCANWLPPQVDPSHFEAGSPTPIIPEPSDVIHNTFWTHRFFWSPDSHFLASQLVNTSDNVVWNVETRELILTFYGRGVEWNLENGVYAADVGDAPFYDPDILGESPDGSQIVQHYDYGARIIDAETDEQIFYILDDTRSVTFSPDGRLLATASPYFRVRIWDTETWELIITLNTNGSAVAFSPDGQTLAVANSWDIELYNVDELLSHTD